MATKASSAGGRRFAAVVLAAGRGKRFPGVASKVLVPVAGRALVLRVLDALAPLAPHRVVVVVGHGKEAVREAVAGAGVETVDQGEPRGTGHAVAAAGAVLGEESLDLLVLNGDVPLLRTATLGRLLDELDRATAAAVLLTAVVPDPQAYGRVVRRADGTVRAVVEAADATAEERAIREINVGAYAFRAPEIFAVLAGVGSDNAQGELYLTDAVRALVGRGERVSAVVLDDPLEAQGVNTPAEREALEAALLCR